MGTEPSNEKDLQVHAKNVTVYAASGGGGHSEPPQARMAIYAFGGGLVGGILGALICLLLRHCGCG
jgi:hypothetical protein